MEIKPIGERVLIRPVKAEEKTEKGIYLPDESRDEKKEAVVLEVGKTKDGKDLPLSKGDRVLYGGYSSDEFEINGEKYIIIDFKDILAKIEE